MHRFRIFLKIPLSVTPIRIIPVNKRLRNLGRIQFIANSSSIYTKICFCHKHKTFWRSWRKFISTTFRTNSIYCKFFIYIHKNLFLPQAQDLLEKLAEIHLYNFQDEFNLLQILHLYTQKSVSATSTRPFGEVGGNSSLQLSSRTHFARMEDKKVIAKN